MTLRSSTLAGIFVADPKDRFLTPIDPWLRNAKRRFIALVIIVCLLHAGLLAFLFWRDHSKPRAPQQEVPVEVVVMPPPPPPEKKKEQPKPQPKPKPQEKQKVHREKPATDIPRAPNDEKIKREETDKQTQAPTRDKPLPNAEMKPTPDKVKPMQNAAPEPAERTAAPAMPDDDKPDAEALSKAAPIKDTKPTQKAKPAKQKTPLPSRERASLAQEFAALSQSPHFSIAARAKPAPISGGHCNTSTYLCTLYALIMRQQHYTENERARAMRGTAVVAFWLDDRGDLTHQALYRTSGFPELDQEAVNAIRRAAPFPPPPPDQPHGFVAQMAFPPK